MYSHAGKGVCVKTFRFLHTVGEKRLKNLYKSFKENGLTPRVHGNTHRRPKHSLSFQSTEYVSDNYNNIIIIIIRGTLYNYYYSSYSGNFESRFSRLNCNGAKNMRHAIYYDSKLSSIDSISVL